MNGLRQPALNGDGQATGCLQRNHVTAVLDGVHLRVLPGLLKTLLQGWWAQAVAHTRQNRHGALKLPKRGQAVATSCGQVELPACHIARSGTGHLHHQPRLPRLGAPRKVARLGRTCHRSRALKLQDPFLLAPPMGGARCRGFGITTQQSQALCTGNRRPFGCRTQALQGPDAAKRKAHQVVGLRPAPPEGLWLSQQFSPPRHMNAHIGPQTTRDRRKEALVAKRARQDDQPRGHDRVPRL